MAYGAAAWLHNVLSFGSVVVLACHLVPLHKPLLKLYTSYISCI